MAGIRQLANELELSIGTVSRALNDRPDVNPETRARVKAAAMRAGYVPNQSGRSLRSGRTGMVAAVIPTRAPSADSGLLTVLEGVRRTLRAHNLDLILLFRGPEEDPLESLQRIVQRRIADSIVISETTARDPRLAYLQAAGVEYVAFGRSAGMEDYPFVDFDVEADGGGDCPPLRPRRPPPPRPRRQPRVAELRDAHPRGLRRRGRSPRPAARRRAVDPHRRRAPHPGGPPPARRSRRPDRAPRHAREPRRRPLRRPRRDRPRRRPRRLGRLHLPGGRHPRHRPGALALPGGPRRGRGCPRPPHRHPPARERRSPAPPRPWCRCASRRAPATAARRCRFRG